MRMDFKVLIFVLAVWSATPVLSWWSLGGRQWSETKPSDCPSNDTETHVCRDLYATNATCVTIKCCRDFDNVENYIEYDSEDEHDDNMCVVCISIRHCVAYTCYDRCCDGYERDMYGACQNATGDHECQNGGTKMYGRCNCPDGFTGTSCEIPMCHCENGECIVKDGRPYCNCSRDYYGEYCDHARCTLECLNGGTCYKQGEYEKCLCPDQYIGKYCEQYFESPKTCPANEYPSRYCETQCMNDDGCYGDQVCCREGCSTVCRTPVIDHCEYNGMEFQFGESFKPSPCEDCLCTKGSGMQCVSMACAYPMCPYGRNPEVKPGECCPSCPDEPQHKPPTMYNCQVYKMYVVNTTKNSAYAYLKSCNLGIYALDENDKKLEVQFRPDKLRRHTSHSQKHTIVTAIATDSNGKRAMCTIAVTVKDIYNPEYVTCPGDVYVFDNEQAWWKEPTFRDNVGIAEREQEGEGESGDTFEVGEHKFTDRIFDYDDNVAECRFRVIVTDRNTDFEDLPTGLKQRSKDTAIKLAIILAPIIGGIALLAIIIIALCCFMRRRARYARSTSSRSVRTAYDNNIYDIPADVTDKPDKPMPPVYTELPLPQNPPAYSRTGSFKGSVYESEAPPSYSNPEYETVGEGMKPIETITQ